MIVSVVFLYSVGNNLPSRIFISQSINLVKVLLYPDKVSSKIVFLVYLLHTVYGAE